MDAVPACRVGAWYLAASLLTFSYMLGYSTLTPDGRTTTPVGEVLLIVGRNAALVALLVELLVAIAPRRRAD